MKRVSIAVFAFAALTVLTSFALVRHKTTEPTKVVQHEGPVTYVWEMNGSDVIGVTIYAVEGTLPNRPDVGLHSRHFQLKAGGK
jgi:hypothetical protein